MSEFRYDLGGLSAPQKMPNGWLKVDGYLTKAGVFEYRNPDGTKRLELRPDEEVFKADSLSSFSLVPVTDEHPSTVLDSTNTAQYQKGSVGEAVRRDGDAVRASMLITDGALAEKMKNGKCGLSCGYEVDLEPRAGNHPVYGRYDAVQRNIRGNHVAVVAAGRAGPVARVRMDEAVQVEREDAQWTGAFIDSLPDSAFLYVESGGKKDGEGKTVPRSLRHFPVRGSDGKADPAHVRNALARIPQSNVPASVKAEATKKAQDLLRQRSDMIEKRGGKWCVYSADGSKKLGEYDTEEEAKKRLGQIEAMKHADKTTKCDQLPAQQAPARTIGVTMNEELKAALADAAAQKSRADALEAEVIALKTRLDAADGTADSLKVQLAEAGEKLRADSAGQIADLTNQVTVLTSQVGALKDDLTVANDPARRRADVRSRVKLEAAAAAVLGSKFNADSMDDNEVICAVLEKLHGSVPKDRSTEYLRARFDAAVDGYFAGEAALARVRDVVRVDEARARDARTAREKMIQYNRNRSTTEEK